MDTKKRGQALTGQICHCNIQFTQTAHRYVKVE